MKSVTIYTDGACSGNPGPGGWGAILCYNDKKKEISGGEEKTTNNRMELMGAIVALETLKESCHVELYSDSKYLVDAFLQKWIFGWEKANWKRKGNKEVPNKELWKRLLVQYRRHEIVFNWVKGHADNEFNNRCDELAVAEWKKIKNQSAEA
ncbi:MAG: ribonuclease HI [Spirochaetales bacterium]|nr:ribonuclease HI [Spirochaetales bacterium]